MRLVDAAGAAALTGLVFAFLAAVWGARAAEAGWREASELKRMAHIWLALAVPFLVAAAWLGAASGWGAT